MNYTKPINTYKSKIRAFAIGDVEIPETSSLPFLKAENGNNKAFLAIEVMMHVPNNYSPILKEYWGDVINDMPSWFEKVQETECDIVALKFNINEENEIPKALELLNKILTKSKKTLLITGSNKKNLDAKLLHQIAETVNRPSIIGIAEEENYKSFAKIIAEKGHAVVARTPIDINLAKELNILLTEYGVSSDKILIDTNMAALGYGLDYGYSIMEKVKLAGLGGDEMLNMPIIAFVGEEAWKAKEARIDNFEKNYGTFKERAIAWESATATSIMLAGANILVLWHPDVLAGLKNFMEEI